MNSRNWLIAAAVLWLLACALPAICIVSPDSPDKSEVLPGGFLALLTVIPPAWLLMYPLLGFLGNVCVWFGMICLRRVSKPQSGFAGLAWIMTIIFVLYAFGFLSSSKFHWTIQLTATAQRGETTLLPGFFVWWLSLAMTSVGLTLHMLEAKTNDDAARMEQVTRKYRGK